MRQNRRFIKEVISFTHFCVLQCYLRIYNKGEINETTEIKYFFVGKLNSHIIYKS